MGRKTQCCSDSKGYKGSVVSCRPELVMPETTVSNNLHETKTDPLFIKTSASSGELPICTLLWPFDIRDNVPSESFCFHSVVTLTHTYTTISRVRMKGEIFSGVHEKLAIWVASCGWTPILGLILSMLLECWRAANLALMSTVHLHESSNRWVLEGQNSARRGTHEKEWTWPEKSFSWMMKVDEKWRLRKWILREWITGTHCWSEWMSGCLVVPLK